MSESQQEPRGPRDLLLPPSHFQLRPPSTRPSGVEPDDQKGRGQDQRVEPETSKCLPQAAWLVPDDRNGRGQAQRVEPETSKCLPQAPWLVSDDQKGRGQAQGAEPEGQFLEGLLFRARLSALGQILTLQEQQLGRELLPVCPVAPAQCQSLLSCWRQKVFGLLVQLRVQEELQRGLRAQVAEGRQQVAKLERDLRREEGTKELLRKHNQLLALEVRKQQSRAEEAEEALKGLVEAVGRLWQEVTKLQAEVTKANSSLGTFSHRLQGAAESLRGLVALERAGDRGDSSGTVPSLVPSSSHPLGTETEAQQRGVAPEEVTLEQATTRGDRLRDTPRRAALGSLLCQLQALGATILGDVEGDNLGPDLGPEPELGWDWNWAQSLSWAGTGTGPRA